MIFLFICLFYFNFLHYLFCSSTIYFLSVLSNPTLKWRMREREDETCLWSLSFCLTYDSYFSFLPSLSLDPPWQISWRIAPLPLLSVSTSLSPSLSLLVERIWEKPRGSRSTLLLIYPELVFSRRNLCLGRG